MFAVRKNEHGGRQRVQAERRAGQQVLKQSGNGGYGQPQVFRSGQDHPDQRNCQPGRLPEPQQLGQRHNAEQQRPAEKKVIPRGAFVHKPAAVAAGDSAPEGTSSSIAGGGSERSRRT